MVNEIYNQMESSSVEKSYKWRAKFFGPLLRFLQRRGVTANQITYLRALVLLVIMYFMFIRLSLVTSSIIYFLVFWGLDAIDGALARHAGTASDHGKFNDVIIDQTSYALFLMGLAFLGKADVFLLFLHVILSGLVYILAVIVKNFHRPTDWLIHAEPNLMYLKVIASVPILLLVLFKLNIMNLTFFALNIWMTILAFYYFTALQRSDFRRVK